MYSVAFSIKMREHRARALAKGLRIKPYTRDEVLAMDGIQLDNIRRSVLTMAEQWDEKEFAYFVSEPHIRLLIDSYRPRKKTVYIEAKEGGEIEFYIMYHERYQEFWDGGYHKKYLFADDYEDYLKNETVSSLDHAKALGMVDEYFSGIGIFPVVDSKRRIMYKGEYELYISQLTSPQYLELVAKNRNYVPAKFQAYDDPRTFVDTSLDQVEKYVEIIQNLESPIYIPGDGIGIGSYVAQMIGKEFFSSEPAIIGKEARLCGLITSDRPFMLLDCCGCKTVFLANMMKFIDNDIFKMLVDSGQKICIWDEQPNLKYGKWYNGGDVRLWCNYPTKIMVKESKLKYDRTLVSLSMKFNLIPVDNLCRAMMLKLGIENNDKSPLNICVYPQPNIASYCVLTRSFNFDLKNGRVGQVKDICGQQVEWSENILLLDGYVGTLPLKQYEDKVIRNLEYDGTYFKVREKVPGYKRYVQMGDFRYKVAHVSYDRVTKMSSYMLNSEFGYRKKLEILDS